MSGPNVALTLLDRTSGNIIRSGIAYITVNGTKSVDALDAGVLRLDLAEGTYRIGIILDDPSTSGKDYASSFGIVQKDYLESSVNMEPSASVYGLVVDLMHNGIPSANVSVDCGDASSDVPSVQGVTADAYGSFRFDVLPAKGCTLGADAHELLASVSMNLSRGEERSVIFLLTPKKASPLEKNLLLLILSLLIVIFLFAMLYLRRERRRRAGSKKHEGHAASGTPHHAADGPHHAEQHHIQAPKKADGSDTAGHDGSGHESKHESGGEHHGD